MSASTPPMTIVEIDGLHFKIQKFRGRRSTRGMVTLTRLLGAGVLKLLASSTFENLDDEAALAVLAKLIAQSPFSGGKATDPDEFERACDELIAWSKASGGQGVSYTDGDGDGEHWIKLHNLSGLDPFEAVDYSTWLTLLWEVVKLNYRPTSAGSGTKSGTSPADMTDSEESAPSAKRTGVLVG